MVENTYTFYLMLKVFFVLNPIQDGPFQGCLRIGGGEGKKPPPPPLKICHTYPTMMKLGTGIPYLNKI